VDSIYEVPLVFQKQGLDEQITMLLRLRTHSRDMDTWNDVCRRLKSPKHHVTIAMAGKYTDYKDAYKSVNEALLHGGIANETKVHIRFLDTTDPEIHKKLEDVHGILVPGGFGDRGIEGKVCAIRYAREKRIPFFGICLGMQVAVIEYARSVAKLEAANSSEINPTTPYPVIDLLPEQKEIENLGGTMRLGLYPCKLAPGSLAVECYGDELVYERHRHRYEFNNQYRDLIESAGLRISGTSPDGRLVEMVELPDHPWFLAVQFHPEFTSRPNRPQPLFREFVKAAFRLSH
jgi:CTP synthase